MKLRRRDIYLCYFGLLLIVLPIWEYAGQSIQSVRILVSSPTLVFNYFMNNSVELFQAAWITFAEAALGFLIATAVCFVVLFVVFISPSVMQLVLPIMIASQVIPLIVLAPFFVLALGIGMPSKVAMAAVLCFFPTFIGFCQGYRLIDREFHNLLDVLNAPLLFRIRTTYLPLALPSGMAGLKVSATLSVIGAIVAEISGAEVGLGRNLFLSTIRLQPELMVSSLIGACVLGAIMYGAVNLLEYKVGHWYLSPNTRGINEA